MAQVQNFVIDQGSKFVTSLVIDNPDSTPRDLTGMGARGQMRKNYGSTTAIDLTVSIPLPVNGLVAITLAATETRAIRPGRYVYDIELYDPDDEDDVTRVLEGLITVTPATTQPE